MSVTKSPARSIRLNVSSPLLSSGRRSSALMRVARSIILTARRTEEACRKATPRDLTVLPPEAINLQWSPLPHPGSEIELNLTHSDTAYVHVYTMGAVTPLDRVNVISDEGCTSNVVKIATWHRCVSARLSHNSVGFSPVAFVHKVMILSCNKVLVWSNS